MMNRSLAVLLFLMVFFLPVVLWAQENIPLDSWRSHFSYRGAYSLAVAKERVYAASANSLYYFDREDNSIQVLTPLHGLSDAGVNHLAYQEENGILLIAYRNGNIDLLQDGEIFNIPTILEASLPGEREVNHVLFQDNAAFLATDYGISILDLQSKKIQESFFNLGPSGQAAEVLQLAIWNDSIFAATNTGVIGNALRGANLSDFNSWKRFEAEDFPEEGEIMTLLGTAQGLFAGMDGLRLLKWQNGQWVATGFETDRDFSSLKVTEEGILIAVEDALFLFKPENGSSNLIHSPLIDSPREAGMDDAGNLWIVDGRNGLLSKHEGEFRAYVPQGPLADVPQTIYTDEERIIAVFEPDTVGEMLGNAGGFSVFADGNWQNYTSDDTEGMPAIKGLSDVVFNPKNNRYYFTSSTDGLLEWDPATNTFRQFKAGTEGVSLQSNDSGETPLESLAVDAAGNVWMIQPGTAVPLHRFNPADNKWQGFLENNARAGKAQEILVLPNNDKWLRLDDVDGILVFNEETDQIRYFTGQTSGGILLEKEVTALEMDLEGQLWVGLEQGVNYFPNPNVALTDPVVNVVFPVYERRHLLNAERVTSIEVDGGNRKWVGTPNGIWVVGDYGDTIYHSFSTANSPLPDNHVLSMAMDQQNGEVFIATSSGIVSYRSGATAAGFEHAEEIKVYPNPVYPGYSGKVGITGLARDVIVKITDMSGKLIKELSSEGGTASWDLTDTHGRRPATGVYLIFSATVDGVETLAGKMAIVN